jgi:Mg2+/Co2+ transporter CorB
MGSEIVILIAIVLLLVASAFFSGSETALTGASRARIHTMEQQGDRRALRVARLWGRREQVIGALLVGNNLVNITASTLSASLFIDWFGPAGIIYATIAMTVLVVLFSEVMPKTYAIHHADQMALFVARPVSWLVAALAPVTKAVDLLVKATMGLFGVRFAKTTAEQEVRAEEELRGAIDLHARPEEPAERAMLRSILDLADVQVGEIMTHRRDTVAIDADLPAEEIMRQVLDSPYTRLPLWRGNPDNIVGVLHAKRLLRALQAAGSETAKLDVMSVAQSPWFIPDSTDLLQQLQAFRERHEHFALVVDEYGVFLGIVTLEDILEEIVGEIADEHDEPIEGVKAETDGSYVIDGRVTLRDLNRQFDWRLPDDEASTIAGLVLYEARAIPDVGQVFAFHGFRFEILGRQRHQITKVKVTPLADVEKAEAAAAAPPAPTAA